MLVGSCQGLFVLHLFHKMLVSIVIILIIFGNEAYSLPIDDQDKKELPAAAATEVFGKDNGINY